MKIFIKGYIIFLTGYPIVWKSKKQSIVTISIIKTEFINLTSTALNIKWIAEIYAKAGYL